MRTHLSYLNVIKVPTTRNAECYLLLICTKESLIKYDKGGVDEKVSTEILSFVRQVIRKGETGNISLPPVIQKNLL